MKTQYVLPLGLVLFAALSLYSPSSLTLTGDEARLEEDGSITVYGRGSNCINTGGEKVFPEEVEQPEEGSPVHLWLVRTRHDS